MGVSFRKHRTGMSYDFQSSSCPLPSPVLGFSSSSLDLFLCFLNCLGTKEISWDSYLVCCSFCYIISRLLIRAQNKQQWDNYLPDHHSAGARRSATELGYYVECCPSLKIGMTWYAKAIAVTWFSPTMLDHSFCKLQLTSPSPGCKLWEL